jgi:CRP-like cAMP-binding protein
VHEQQNIGAYLKFPDPPADGRKEGEMTYLMKDVRLFEAFSDLDRADLVQFMHEKHFAVGDTVCTRGEPGSTMMVVVQGSLSVVVPGKDNLPSEIARLAQGAVLGEMFCIDPAPRPVSVMAAEPATVLELGRDDLTKMRQDAPRAASALIGAVFREVLRRMRRVDDRVEREQFAEETLDLSRENAGSPRPKGSEVPGPWEACFARLRGSA